MRPDRNPWVPSLLGAAILAMAALAPGGLAQNTSDPPAGGNETMEASSDGTADRLSYTDGHAEGRFVSFDLDPTTGTVCDWTYKGQLVLDEIHWGEFSADVRQSGAAVVVTDTGASASGGSSPPGGASGGNGGSGGGGDGSPYQSMENGTGNQTGNGTDDGTGTGGNATGNETATPPGNETVAPTGACAGQPAAENETSTGGNGSESSRGASAPAGGSSRMLLHDNPIGSIKAELRGTEELAFVVADGFGVSMDGDRVTVQGGGFEARLWKDQDSKEGDLSVDGQVVSVGSAHKANLMWRVVDAGSPGDSEIADAQEDGRVACEVLVLPDGDVVSESGEDGDVVISTSRSETSIDVTIDIDVTQATTAEEQPTASPTPPQEQPDNGTGNETGNTTTDGNATTSGGSASGNGTVTANATAEAVAVVVIDLDVSVVAGASAESITVLLDGAPVQEAASVAEVLAAVEAEAGTATGADADGGTEALAEAEASAFVGGLPDGGLRVVSTAESGSHVLSLQAAAPTFEAEAVPTFGDSSDDAEASSGSEGGALQENDSGEDGGTDISVPAPPFAALLLALLAAAAFAIRRQK